MKEIIPLTVWASNCLCKIHLCVREKEGGHKKKQEEEHERGYNWVTCVFYFSCHCAEIIWQRTLTPLYVGPLVY